MGGTPSRQKVYGMTKPLIDVFPFPVYKNAAPTTNDTGFEIGQVWVYKVSATVRYSYMYGGVNASNQAIWMQTSAGVNDLATLTGTSGGAISPTDGNITFAAGTGVLSIVGAGSTLTFNVNFAAPPAIGSGTPAAGSFTTLTHAKENYTTLSSGAAAGASYAGTVALVAGTVVVSTTAVTATSQIRLTCQGLGTVTAPSALCVSAKSTGISFTILASQNTDTSTIFWEVIN